MGFPEKLPGKPASNKERQEQCRQKNPETRRLLGTHCYANDLSRFLGTQVVILYLSINPPLLFKAKVVLLLSYTLLCAWLSSTGEQNKLAFVPDTWVLHNKG